MSSSVKEELAPSACPICGRAMLATGRSVDRHHLVPRSQGGKDQFLLHRMCHQKIHSLFTEKELARSYSTWELLRTHPDVQTFVSWIQKKSIDYYDRNVRSSRKR